MHFHSYLDSSVPYQGGFGDGVSDHYNPPLDSVLDIWSVHNTCTSLRDTLVDDDRYTLTHWKNCDCQSEMWFYLTRDGGHSWPGGSKTIIGDPVSTHINASELMWDFFSNYSLACNLTSAIDDQKTDKAPFLIFPNPTSGTLNLDSQDLPFDNLKIFDSNGRLLNLNLKDGHINLAQLRSGIYYITIKVKGKIFTRKIVKY
jgi:polyhydroxybutyrate depolymerase